MGVRLRLVRIGVANSPFYAIVSANARAVKPLETLGAYNPIADNGTKHIELDVSRVKYWLSVGAQPSSRVAWLLAKAGIMPQDPKLLHRMGIVDLNDKSKWNVQLKHSDGSQSVVSRQDAEKLSIPLPSKPTRVFSKPLQVLQDLPTKKMAPAQSLRPDALRIIQDTMGIN